MKRFLFVLGLAILLLLFAFWLMMKLSFGENCVLNEIQSDWLSPNNQYKVSFYENQCRFPDSDYFVLAQNIELKTYNKIFVDEICKNNIEIAWEDDLLKINCGEGENNFTKSVELNF